MKISRNGRFAAAAVLFLAVLLAAYAGHGVYEKRKLARTVAALVAENGAHLATALQIDPNPAAPDHDARQSQLDAAAASAAVQVGRLRGLDAAPARALADDADEYLVASREILRRFAAAYRYRTRLAASKRALTEHMRTGNRGGDWMAHAIQAKAAMDNDYRDFRRASEALAGLLGGYSISRTRIAMHLPDAALPDGHAAEAARARVLEAAAAAAEEVEKAGRLYVYR